MSSYKINKKAFFQELFIVIIGNLLLAFSISFCFINYKGTHIYGVDESGNLIISTFNGILSGGTTGFSLILRNLFFASLTNQDFIVETIITITTWALFILGSFFLGKKFIFNTLLSTILYPIFIYLYKLNAFNSLHEQFNLLDPVICAFLGGFIMGLGCGMIYKIGGSTGGFDIPGLIINKLFRFKLSIVYFVTDAILIVLAVVAKYNLYEIVIGLISVIAYSITVDIMQRVGTSAYFCDIISDKYEQINQAIIKLDRGSTIVDVTGGFTGAPRKMIKTMVSKNQYLEIIDIVKRIDPSAFVSMTKTYDVFGEGYTDIEKFSNK